MIKKLSVMLKVLLGESWFYFVIYKAAYLFKVLLIIRPNISKSLKSLTITKKTINEAKPLVVVPILETNHHMHLHILGMAKAFSVRGFEVLVIVCDEYLPACEIKNCRTPSNINPCFLCNSNRLHLLDLFGLKTVTLSVLFSQLKNPVEYGRQVMQDFGLDQARLSIEIEDSVTRHFYGAAGSYPEEDVLLIRQKHTDVAYMSLALGRLMLETYSPSICFNVMRNYSAWGPIFHFFESVGVAPITMTSTAFDFGSVRLNDSDLFRHRRTYERFLSQRANAELNDAERSALMTFLNNRHSGNDSLMKKWNYFDSSEIGYEGVDKSKKNVFLFTNVPWDVGLSEFAGPFDGVLDWVYQTIEYFKDNKAIDIWIKPHPAEVRSTSKSEQSVSDFIRQKYSKLPRNVHVIEPEKGINTYGLFNFIDVGVILTGTLGLEMALDGIPVVSAGINPCYGLGLLSEPKDIGSYFRAIEADSNVQPEKTRLELFCYFYFIHQCFQWPISDSSFGDNFLGFNFKRVHELEKGEIDSLDAIFEEIELLIADYKETATDI